jgi:hypothetical protein
MFNPFGVVLTVICCHRLHPWLLIFNPFGVGRFALNYRYGLLFENPLQIILKILPLFTTKSLKGFNMNSHGCNPWSIGLSKANPGGVE